MPPLPDPGAKGEANIFMSNSPDVGREDGDLPKEDEDAHEKYGASDDDSFSLSDACPSPDALFEDDLELLTLTSPAGIFELDDPEDSLLS